MYIEFSTQLGATNKKVFIRTDRKGFSNAVSPIHSHRLCEIHIVAFGEVSFKAAGNVYQLNSGSVLAIPCAMPHECTFAQPDNVYTSFFISANIKNPVLHNTIPSVAMETIEEYKRCVETGNYSKLAAIITFLCQPIFEDEKIFAEKTSDYSLILEDYFALNYAHATLGELAKELCLSEKQTERIVLKSTGLTFKQKLSLSRTQVANILLREGKMSKKEIAEYVGYNSYSGFYKAINGIKKP